MQRIVILALLLLAPAIAPAQSATDLFQRALMYERTERRLDSAIILYRRVARQAGPNRALAARALLSLGRAYEMLGRVEARAAYEQLLREYADQGELVTEARSRIAALGTANGSSVTVHTIWRGAEVMDASGSMSLDGRYLSFTDWNTGDLALRDLVARQSRRLTNIPGKPWDSGDFAVSSRVSPDGRQVAYAWFIQTPQEGRANYQLRVLSPRGGAARTFPIRPLAWVAPYAWSPDGAHLLAGVQYEDDSARRSFLVLVRVADGTITELRDLGSNVFTTNASISPDGRWIAYDRPSDGRWGRPDVHVMAIDGSRDRTVIRNAASDWAAKWTPDASGIAFLSDRTGAWSLWHQRLADGAPVGEPTLLRSDIGRVDPLGFTSDGRFLFHPLRLRDVAVATLDPESGAVIEEPRIVTSNMVGSHQQLDWSPDGRALAMISMRGTWNGMPNSRALVIVDAVTGEQRDYVLPLAHFFAPRWSPDGRSILVTGGATDPGGGLHVVDAATGAMRTIAQSSPITYRSEWSRDGRSVFFQRNDTSTQPVRRLIGRFDLADSSFHDVGTAPELSWAADVMQSKDGRLLAYSGGFVRGEATEMEVHLLDLRTGEDRRLRTPRGDGLVALNWASDSTLIGISRRDSLTVELWRISIDGGPPRKLAFEAYQMNRLRLNPDGRRIAYETSLDDSRFGEIRVIRNLLVRPASRSTSAGSSAQEVWAGADVVASSRPSPDGRFLATLHVPSLDLVVRDLERDTSLRLTNTGSVRDYAEVPVFSGGWKTDCLRLDQGGRCVRASHHRCDGWSVAKNPDSGPGAHPPVCLGARWRRNPCNAPGK